MDINTALIVATFAGCLLALPNAILGTLVLVAMWNRVHRRSDAGSRPSNRQGKSHDILRNRPSGLQIRITSTEECRSSHNGVTLFCS